MRRLFPGGRELDGGIPLFAETSRVRRRELATITGNCPGCPVYRGEFPHRGELTAEKRGELSTTRQHSTLNPVKKDLPA